VMNLAIHGRFLGMRENEFTYTGRDGDRGSFNA